MTKATTLFRETLDVSEKYRIELEVLRITASKRYPEGVKVSFVLIDLEIGAPRLVVDNHAPFGFHAHTELPRTKEIRLGLTSRNYLEALDTFWNLVAEILESEN